MIEEAIDKLVEHCPKDMIILKVVEECAELQEVMVKYLTKREELKPSMGRISEEMGDVMFRIMVAVQLLGLEDAVELRIETKAKELYDWAVNKFETFKN